MKCRALVQDDNKYQNIVWFGSYGKNEDYILLKEEPEDFKSCYFKYYRLTSITQNYSDVWDKTKEYYLMFNGDFILTKNKPDNWEETYTQYCFLKSTTISQGTSFVLNSFYLHNNAKFYKPENKRENYSYKQESVKNSLIQRLSVIKGELWYKASYGLPLMDKIKNKGIYDSVIINIISEHPDVKNIIYYNSTVEENRYTFNFIVESIYNEEVEINYTI